MLLLKPSFVIEQLKPREDILRNLETFGRVCYKSEDLISLDSASKFCSMILKRNHLSVIEHESMTVRFICDRGFTHELVRHRLASFSQESTRYCNYSKKGVAFILPPWVEIEPGNYIDIICRHEVFAVNDYIWYLSLKQAEDRYIKLIENGWSPQQARSILPNSLKTEIIVTANLREWQHIFTLRCNSSAHPQMQELMVPLRNTLRGHLPEIFNV